MSGDPKSEGQIPILDLIVLEYNSANLVDFFRQFVINNPHFIFSLESTNQCQ